MEIETAWPYKQAENQFIQLSPIKLPKDWIPKIYNISEIEIIDV